MFFWKGSFCHVRPLNSFSLRDSEHVTSLQRPDHLLPWYGTPGKWADTHKHGARPQISQRLSVPCPGGRLVKLGPRSVLVRQVLWQRLCHRCVPSSSSELAVPPGGLRLPAVSLRCCWCFDQQERMLCLHLATLLSIRATLQGCLSVYCRRNYSAPLAPGWHNINLLDL